jgi:hypothetical protein
MSPRKRSAAVASATPRSAEESPKHRLNRDERELAAALAEVRRQGAKMAAALRRLDEATAWVEESRREARRP